jgi:3-hydroxyacyl-CoA dehydrogenase
MTLGGGAEVAMAGDRVVAGCETYMGLVEVGVGLIPAGGGCKEIVRRLVSPHMKVDNPFPGPWLQNAFMAVGQARVRTSAEDARSIGFLRADDVVVMNKEYLLAEAKREVLAMAASGYKADHPVRNVYAAGRDQLANLRVGIHMMKEGGYISDYDAHVGNKLAYVLCGGELSQPQWVDEQYFLDLERDVFLSLAGEPKTLERIFHMLQTGKPLRN